MNQKHSQNIFHVNPDVNLMVENVIQNKNRIMMSRKSIKHWVYEEDYVWNPSISACESDKHYKIKKYLKDCTGMKSLTHDLVITCDEIVDKPEATLFSLNDKTNHRFIAFVLLSIVYLLLLLLLVVIIVK